MNRNGQVTSLQHLCRWGSYACTEFQWSQGKGGVDFSRCTLGSKFRKSQEQWHVAFSGPATKCLVRVETRAFSSFLCLHWQNILSVWGWGIFVWRTASLHIQTSSSAKKSSCARSWLWTNSNYGADKHGGVKAGQTYWEQFPVPMVWFDGDDALLHGQGLYPLSVATHCTTSSCWAHYKQGRRAQHKRTQSSPFPRKSQFLRSTCFRYGQESAK